MIKKILKAPYLLWVILAFTFLLLLSMIPLGLSSLFNKATEEKIVYRTIKLYSWLTCLVLGAIPKIYNKGVLKDEKRVILPNHTSYIDPVSTYVALDRPFKTLGKIEVARIPIFGYLYRKSVILVDRSSKESKTQAFLQMEEYLKFMDILLFPQGTISDNSLYSTTIYPGGFLLAKQYHSAIYPMLMLKNKARLDVENLWNTSPGIMPILFLQPINSQIVIDNSVKDVMKLYNNYMEACIDFALHQDPKNIGEYSKQKLEELSSTM